MSSTVVFLQARLGSKRLPEKVLKYIGNRPMISYVVERLRLIEGVQDVVLLTSTMERDSELEAWCAKNEVACFRGSEENVLERYYQASLVHPADHYIRATGDNPLVDPYFAGLLLKKHIAGTYDYSSNKSEVNSHLPDGMGVEIFSRFCLGEAYRKSTDQHHFEHVNEYILENSHEFRINYLGLEDIIQNFSSVRLTVDTPEDFEKISRIILSEKYKSSAKLSDILKIL